MWHVFGTSVTCFFEMYIYTTIVYNSDCMWYSKAGENNITDSIINLYGPPFNFTHTSESRHGKRKMQTNIRFTLNYILYIKYSNKLLRGT